MQYINSTSILIGGEIDRVVSIVIVTLVLSVSVARARQLLFHAVGAQAAVSQLSRFVAAEVAERLSSADELLHSGPGRAAGASSRSIVAAISVLTRASAAMATRACTTLSVTGIGNVYCALRSPGCAGIRPVSIATAVSPCRVRPARQGA